MTQVGRIKEGKWSKSPVILFMVLILISITIAKSETSSAQGDYDFDANLGRDAGDTRGSCVILSSRKYFQTKGKMT